MTDIHAAAERMRDVLEAKSIDWANASDECWADAEVLMRAALNPTLLLKPPVWFQLQCGNYGFRTPWGTYWVNKSGDGWSAAVSLNGLIPIGRYEETAESAQAACLADFRERVRGMFQPVV